jgi:two-component system LytT family response regulator
MKVIVIDDEPPAREELIYLLDEYNDVEVVSECSDVFSALRAVREHQPDAMFLDIILPGHDGFTLLDYMEADEHRPHVVVVSGGPSDFAVRAFGEGVLDYLAKPVEEERLAKTIQRIRERLLIPDEKALPYPDRALEFIPCVFNRRIKFIKPEDVEYIRSDATGVHVISHENEYYTELTLKTLVQKTNLVQCHRQYLISPGAVDEIESLDNGLAEIRTHCKKTVPVSRHYRKNLGQALGLQKE